MECQNADIFALLNAGQIKKFQQLQSELDVAALSSIKLQHRAELERVKGNESFRVAENSEAVACYSRSLALQPRNAVVWANRAMAYIRMELFDLAEADASVALLLDPRYVKALSRRGLVRFKRGKYALAVADFRQALELDPENAELGKLLQTAQDKHLEVEGCTVEEAAAQRGGAGKSLPVQELVLLQVARAQTPVDLCLPSASAEIVAQGQMEEKRATKITSTGFVRVQVVSDEDDSDEEEGGGSAAIPVGDGAGAEKFSRVAVVEDDEDSASDNSEEGVEVAKLATAEAAKEKGNSLLRAGKASEAIAAYSESLQAVPSFVPALNNRAQAYLAMKAYDSCVADCTTVLQLEPGNAKALWRRASARVARAQGATQLSEREGAAVETDIRNLLAVDPSNAAAQQLLLQLRPLPPTTSADSRSSSVQAAQVPLLDVQKLKQRAQQMLGDGLNDKVVGLLGHFLRTVDDPPFSELLQSDRTSLLHLLATAYSSTADYEHAVAVQEAIVRIDPTNFRALYKRAEAQLLIASKAHQQGAASLPGALALAERDIDAALQVQGESAEVLALRQKLLRLRNSSPAPCPPRPTPDTTVPPAPASSSRQQSDLQKELGNKAMAEKQFTNAVHHYTVATELDATNLAAFNNRALAHLKLRSFALAEADASTVIEHREPQSRPVETEGLRALQFKALHRRSQARKALAESAAASKDWRTCQRLCLSALADLQEVLKGDATAGYVLAEQKSVRELLMRCEQALAPMPAVVSAPATPASSRPSPASAAPSRADLVEQKVSSLLSPASQSPSAGPSSVFGGLGMVARSTKKLGSGGSDTTEGPAAAAVQDSPGAGTSSPGGKPKEAFAPVNRSLPTSPLPSVTLSAPPSDPPKTVYEFERVWRSLKARPDLFAQYVCGFKKSTFKKVVKEALSPDLISFMWQAVRDHGPSASAKLKVLAGFSSVPNFSLALSLLPRGDLLCVAELLAQVQESALASSGATEVELATRSSMLSTVGEMRAAYGMSE